MQIIAVLIKMTNKTVENYVLLCYDKYIQIDLFRRETMAKFIKSTLGRVALIAVVLVLIIGAVSFRMKQNELAEKAAVLEEQKNTLQNHVDEMKTDLESPFDEEYVAKIAKDKLGLRYPQEIVYYGNDN